MINLMGVRAVQARIAQLQQQGRFSFRIIRILYTNEELSYHSVLIGDLSSCR